MEEWVRLIEEIGFPIIVSFYLLYRLEAKLEAIHVALVSMKEK
jgi:hypothetical protein